MNITSNQAQTHIKNHPCFHHPIFTNWATVNPEYEIVGALFHQIRCFCDSTRPGHHFPEALAKHGFLEESKLQKEIVESESGHGSELARMAGYIVNKAAKKIIIDDVYDQEKVQIKLKQLSDKYLENTPNYDKKTGFAFETAKARNIFERRKEMDEKSTWYNTGVTLALETISHQHLIPGEKYCLVDSGNYEVSLNDDEMHYLEEHWGELGAEKHHEQNAFQILDSALDTNNAVFVMRGINDFLNSLNAMWDFLDTHLLRAKVIEQVV